MSSRSSRRQLSTSSFLQQKLNLRQLLYEVNYTIERFNDTQQPFNHYTHKNMSWKSAPFLSQTFFIKFQELISVKYLVFQNFTHGCQITVQISEYPNGQFTNVYKEKYVCQGKSLKNNLKTIDLGALPCRGIKLTVNKGAPVCSKTLSIVGAKSSQIQSKLGQQYYKLLVINPMKIIYKD